MHGGQTNHTAPYGGRLHGRRFLVVLDPIDEDHLDFLCAEAGVSPSSPQCVLAILSLALESTAMRAADGVVYETVEKSPRREANRNGGT